MNQKGFVNLIVIGIVLAVVLGVGGYFVLVRKPVMPSETQQPITPPPSVNPQDGYPSVQPQQEKSVETYTATVVQVGGQGSRLVTKTAWYFPETTGQEYLDAEEYALVDFNRGEDIMSLSCQEGYQITSCESPSGKGILNESGYPFGCRILLEEKLKNQILINCSK